MIIVCYENMNLEKREHRQDFHGGEGFKHGLCVIISLQSGGVVCETKIQLSVSVKDLRINCLALASLLTDFCLN